MTFISVLEINQVSISINKYIFWGKNNFQEDGRKNTSLKVLFPSTASKPPSKSNPTDFAILAVFYFHIKEWEKGQGDGQWE